MNGIIILKPADLIRKHYQGHPLAHRVLLEHSRLVTRKALEIARNLRDTGTDVDLDFVAEAAMLHDIGMLFTHAPDLGCRGKLPYLAHGIRGHELLLVEGLPKHARVCERHTGVGLTAREIIEQGLPLPARDMLPESQEEKLICYADLFFSKTRGSRHQEKSPAEVHATLIRYGADKGDVFRGWLNQFEPGRQWEPL